MKRINILLTVFISPILLTHHSSAAADWAFDTFSSGNLKHHIARSDSLPGGHTFELFCTNYDPLLTSALYIPKQNIRKKTSRVMTIRIDRGRQWKLPASAHTMSLVSRQVIDPELLSDLKAGNRVNIQYPQNSKESATLHFALKGSGKALARLEKHCTTPG